jgi:hypothetical protein
MKLSKKKIAEINMISVYEELLQNCSIFNHMNFDDPPDMWSNEQKGMFDLLTEIERKLKDQIINIIEQKSK